MSEQKTSKLKIAKSALALFMAFMISNVPQLAAAEVAGEMISTAAIVEQITRSQAHENVKTHIERTEVKKELEKLGISSAQINERLASLSDAELRDLSKQMDSAQFGSGLEGILVLVILVLLIVFLVKRI